MVSEYHPCIIILVLNHLPTLFGIKNLCYMSHLTDSDLSCSNHSKPLTKTQNLSSQLITLFKMSSQDIYNILRIQPKYWETDSDYLNSHCHIPNSTDF